MIMGEKQHTLDRSAAVEHYADMLIRNGWADADDPSGVVASIEADIRGFGKDDAEAVRDGLDKGLIEMPESDEPLSITDVVGILRHGCILFFRQTPYGVLITDEN